MDKSKNWFRIFLVLAVPLSLVLAAACAKVRVNTLPAPPTYREIEGLHQGGHVH